MSENVNVDVNMNNIQSAEMNLNNLPLAGTTGILQDTINMLKDKHKDHIGELYISDARIGVHMTAVKLSDDSCGISSTIIPQNAIHHFRKELRDYGKFSPGRISGSKVMDLLETAGQSNTLLSLKVAVLNAISSKLLEKPGYKIVRNADPIDFIDLSGGKVISIVGAFQSYIQKISATDNKLYVLEFNENAFSENDKKHYVPAGNYPEVLPVSDIVIITGLTLVNGTIDNLLKSIRPDARIVVTGPSSSIIPDVLFGNNVKIIGAVKITHPEMLLKVVSEGASGYHLFEYCAEKICILNE